MNVEPYHYLTPPNLACTSAWNFIPTLKDLRGRLIVTIRERMVNPIPTLKQSMSIHILRE